MERNIQIWLFADHHLVLESCPFEVKARQEKKETTKKPDLIFFGIFWVRHALVHIVTTRRQPLKDTKIFKSGFS